LISCLGLAAAQRTKEIGIRKILGTSVLNVVGLLSKDFLKLVVAAPLAWFFMNKWLENFAYRTSIPWWVFIAVGAMAVIIALATVSFQAIRAALANPVESLKSE